MTMPFDLDQMKRRASNGYVSGAYVSDLVAVVERFRAALEEIAECPNEGPFLRRLARRALDGGLGDRTEGDGTDGR